MGGSHCDGYTGAQWAAEAVAGITRDRAPSPQSDLAIFRASRENTGNFAYSPVGSSQMVQNIGRITMSYEKILGALEQGNFGSHQGIELGNQFLSGKELSLALVGIC